MSRVYAIRGATTCENTKESILKEVHEMCDQIFIKNNIKSEDLISIHFTMTKDLDQFNAAAALRKGNPCIDCSEVALFTSQEAYIEGGLEKVVRVMVTVWLPENQKLENIYLNKAVSLRPDRIK